LKSWFNQFVDTLPDEPKLQGVAKVSSSANKAIKVGDYHIKPGSLVEATLNYITDHAGCTRTDLLAYLPTVFTDRKAENIEQSVYEALAKLQKADRITKVVIDTLSTYQVTEPSVQAEVTEPSVQAEVEK
jgi:hypothetical protein